jgi:molecular chaperone GrpE (heat shock protein)
MDWLRSLFRRPPTLPPPPEEEPEPPPWVDALLEITQKHARSLAKHGARVEASLGEVLAQVTALQQQATRAAPAAERNEVSYEEIFDALDALDEAQQVAREPHLASGLRRVSERLIRFCERQGFSRASAIGSPPDPRTMRVVGAEPCADVPRGAVARVVRAPIVTANRVVREGEVIVSDGGQLHEPRMGN